MENDEHFCQWVFAAAPSSPFIARVIEEIQYRHVKMRGIDIHNPNFVHYHTGPAAFTVGLAKAFSEHFKTESESHFWQARQWFDFIKKQSIENRVRSKGICIFDAGSFNNRYVQNNYASQMDIKGYESWTVSATNLRISAENRDCRFCSAWQQTRGCNPEGEVEVSTGMSCKSKIEKGISGFCECVSGPVEEELPNKGKRYNSQLANLFQQYVRLGVIHPPSGRIVGARHCDGQGIHVKSTLSCEDLCLEYWQQETRRIELTTATNEEERESLATATSALNSWMMLE